MKAQPEAKIDAVVMAQRIEMWPVENLIPYARNARKHSTAQVQKIVRSIRRFGFTNPILADKNSREIIAGHARLAAALEIGLEKVPVIELSHLSEAERRAYLIADNKLALEASWDFDLLSEEFAALPDLGVDPSLTGFDPAEIDSILNGWRPDYDPTERNASEEELRARIGVTCEAGDKANVVDTIQKAIADSGLAGVEVKA